MVKRLATLVAALLMGMVGIGVFAGVPLAQSGEETYAACDPNKEKILATDLPQTVEEDRCPVADRTIVDASGVGTELPDPGTAIYPELIFPEGSQQLVVENPVGGTFTVGKAGTESGSEPSNVEASPPLPPDAASSNGCGVPNAYSYFPFRVLGQLNWSYNAPSTPNEMSVDRVEEALRIGGSNITQVHNPCGLPDGVGAGLAYNGRTAQNTDINSDGSCSNRDNLSVVGFGTLPRALALHCPKVGSNGGVISSDISFNKADFDFTANISPSCSGRWDVQGIMTHERGHTFGMAHISEDLHPVQTMSPVINGPCQGSERSLGEGDATGLNRKY